MRPLYPGRNRASLYALVFFAFLNPRIDSDLRGRPVVLVHDGQFDERALRKNLLSRQEILTAVRRQGYHDTEHLKELVLEPDGGLTVTMDDDAVTIRAVLAALQRLEQRLDQQTG